MDKKNVHLIACTCLILISCSRNNTGNESTNHSRDDDKADRKNKYLSDLRMHAENKTIDGDDRARKLGFFGLIVDQHQNPIFNATISYGVLGYQVGEHQNSTKEYTYEKTRSDEQGRFEIVKDRALVIEMTNVEAEGMEWLRSRGRMSCSAMIVDDRVPISREHPIVLMMLPTDRVMPILIDKNVTATWNGEATTIPIADTGESIWIRLKRSRSPGQMSGFGWCIEVGIHGGLIQDLHAEGPMLAPTDGYTTIIQHGHEAEDENWSWGLSTKCVQVYETEQKHYGTVCVLLNAAYKHDECSINIMIAHNPTGERYLR